MSELRPKMIGARVQRKEDPRLLTGNGRYVADIQMPRLAHIAFLRSDRPHAHILDIDVSEALAVPGVFGVYTAGDLADQIEPPRATSRTTGYYATPIPPLADGKVRHVGEPVVAVVAASRYIAEDAVGLIAVDYEDLPVLADPEAALTDGANLLHTEAGTNLIVERGFERGDVDEAFYAAAHTVSARFRFRRHTPLALEPRAYLADWDAGRQALTLYSSTQAPGVMRDVLAKHMNLPGSRIKVIAPDVGGGFGSKVTLYPEEMAVCAIAKLAGRPVKWVSDRLEDLTATIQSFDEIIDARLAVDAKGAILGLQADVVGDVGAYSVYPWTAALEPVQVISFLPGPYRVENYKANVRAVATCKSPMGPYRGVGRPVSTFAMERLIDKAAHAVGIEPSEMRRRNLVKPEEFPYKTAVGIVWDRSGFMECLESACASVDVAAFRTEQAAARQEGRYLGLGFGSYSELTGLGSRISVAPGMPINTGTEQARLRLDSTGAVVAALGIANHGQGLETSMAQVIADELGVDMEAVSIEENDSDALSHTTGTYASRSAVLAGGAATLAARGLKEKILNVAAHLMEAPAADLDIVDSAVILTGTDRSMTFREIADAFYSQMGRLPHAERAGMDLEATHLFDPVFGTATSSTHAAIVAVDPATCSIEIKRYIVAEDCGRMINPMIVDGQVHGGVVQGIGAALLEEIIYDEEGQNLTASLVDYLVPSAAEAPDMEVAHIETELPDNVTGFRGMGEGGTIGAPAAIANAISDALAPFGVQVDELPASPQRLFQWIRAGKPGM